MPKVAQMGTMSPRTMIPILGKEGSPAPFLRPSLPFERPRSVPSIAEGAPEDGERLIVPLPEVQQANSAARYDERRPEVRVRAQQLPHGII